MDEIMLFVTVGHPESLTAVAKKIPVKVSENMTEQDAKNAAKKLRQHLARYPWIMGLHPKLSGFVPSEFYWAIYRKFEDTKPVMASDNFYWRKK